MSRVKETEIAGMNSLLNATEKLWVGVLVQNLGI